MSLFRYDRERYGCGSGIFFIKDCFYYEACKQHDIDYKEKIFSRREADQRFLRRMRNIYERDRGGFRQYMKMHIYYAIVVLVGGMYYNGKYST